MTNQSILKGIFLALAITSTACLSQSLNELLGPAPLGDPMEISKAEIAKAEHPCPSVKSAARNQDGTISSLCTNNETYRIFTLENNPIVMRCSAVKELGIEGC